jgi:hypothetical protein
MGDRYIIGLLAVVAAVAACSRSRSPSPARVESAADAAIVRAEAEAEAAAPSPVPQPVLVVDAGVQTGPLARIARVDRFEAMLDGATMGFSGDGRYLGFCISVCDSCPTKCTFDDSKTGTKVVFTEASSFDDPEMMSGRDVDEEKLRERLDKRNAPMKKFLAQQAIPKVKELRTLGGPWPYPDLVLVTRSTMNDARATTVVELGGAIAGAEPAYVMKVELGPHPMWKERPSLKSPKLTAAEKAASDAEWRRQFSIDPGVAAVVDVTPDGKDIGLVGFTRGTGWFEDAALARMPLAKFEARVRLR